MGSAPLVTVYRLEIGIMSVSQPQAIHRENYRPPSYRIDRVELDIDRYAHSTRVRSRLSIQANYDEAEEVRPLELDGEKLELTGIAIDGRALACRLSTDRAKPGDPQPPRQFLLETEALIQRTPIPSYPVCIFPMVFSAPSVRQRASAGSPGFGPAGRHGHLPRHASRKKS